MYKNSGALKSKIVRIALRVAEIVPFWYFVGGGTAFAVAFAFGLYTLQNALFGIAITPQMAFIGIFTPLVTAFICFYFAALVIQRLVVAENTLASYNAELQRKVEEEVESRRISERLLAEQSKLAMMGEMIGAIAHQWRQPLNSLAITIQEVSYVYEDEACSREYIKSFIDKSMLQIRYMSKTIDDFRNFFSPDKEATRFEVKDPIQEAIHIIEAALGSSGINIELKSEDGLFVCGYEGELAQVTLNLLSNAKYAVERSKKRKRFIKVSAFAFADKIIVDVEDSGDGINPKVIDRIFEPYFTTKPQGEGTGIGLYMSRQIVQRHMGGLLTAKNGANGAVFRIELSPCQ